MFVQAAVGVFALAIGAQGFFMNSLGWPKRAIFVATSILLFWPSLLLSLLGVVIIGGMVVNAWRQRRPAVA